MNHRFKRLMRFLDRMRLAVADGTYAQGVAGGLLFGLPLLFTMELWRHGATISADRLLLSMAATLGILILFNRTIGSHPDSTWKEVTMESVEELGLGMITSAVVLLLIGRVRMGMPMQEWIGKVTAEALVTSIGVSIGTVQFGAPSHARVKEGGFPILGQVAIAFCGSIFLAASIAPTEEILLIAVEQSSASALQLLIALVVASAVMLGFSDLRRRPEFRIECGIPRVIFGPIVTVGVSLVTAAFFLWFFRYLEGHELGVALRLIVTLAVPGILGAAAGRVLFQA